MKTMKIIGSGIFLILFFGMIILMNNEPPATVAAEVPQSVPANPSGGLPSITTSLVASGFSDPVAIANGGDNRLFIVERAGVIRIIDESGTVLPTPFLNMSTLVNSIPNERGLLGLAFHPNYPVTPYFYVNYTTNNWDGHTTGDTVVARYQVSGDPDIANANSYMEVMHFSQPDWNHNGGDLQFGPDDYLYISTGDGGGGGDQDNHAQNPSDLLGNILRIDVDGGGSAPECDPDGNYTIPDGNPYADQGGSNCDEIWSIGLRNPWRFSFDRVTGDMFIGDVGQGSWEEIDYQPAAGGGENWGWRCYEGNHTHNTSECGPMGDYDFPIFEYDHSGSGGLAVSGGFVYRGADYPDLVGYYIFGDYAFGNFWVSYPDGGGGWTTTAIPDLPGVNSPSSFGEGCDGELYVAHYSGGGGGAIYQIQTTAVATTMGGTPEFGYLPIIIGVDNTATPTATATTSATPVTPGPTTTATATTSATPTITNTPTATNTATPPNTPTATLTPSPTATNYPPAVCN